MNFATKITSVVVVVLLLVGSLISWIGYKVAYQQMDEAAGIELVGCANITTGLVNPEDVGKLADGDITGLAQLEERLNWTVDHKEIFKEVFILTLDGKLLAVDKRMKANGYQAGDTYYLTAKDRDMILNMKHSLYSDVYHYNGEQLKTGYGPIYKDHDPNKEIIALMAINFDADIIHERTMDTISTPLLAGLAVAIIGIALIFLVIQRMMKPVVSVSDQVNQIAKGNLILEPLIYKGKDEVGTLTRDMNVMRDNLYQLLQDVNGSAIQVAASSQQLNASSEQTSKASEQIAAVTLELASGTYNQNQNLEQSTLIMGRMSEVVQEIALNAEGVTDHAVDTAGKAETGLHISRSAINQMSAIGQTMDELTGTVKQLGEYSKEIGKMTEAITEIASQTNLLALNAAIEAARAGEEGKGFAVVADSIRKLAEQSRHSAQQISMIVNVILEQMDKAAASAESASKEVGEGAELVRSAGSAFETIKRSSTYTAEAISQVTHAVNRLSHDAAGVVESLQELLFMSNKIAEGTHDVSAASEEQLATMQEVAASAEFLSTLATELQTLIDKFRM